MAASFTCIYSILVTETSPNPCTALRLAAGHMLKITISWPLSGIMSRAGPSAFRSSGSAHHQSLTSACEFAFRLSQHGNMFSPLNLFFV